MERRTFVFLLILPALVIAWRWKSSSKPAWRRGDSLDRPGGWYGRRDDEPTRRREDPLDWSGDRYDSRDDDDVRYARGGDQYNWRDDRSSRQNYRYDERDRYDGRDRYNKRGDNQDDRRSYRYKTPTPPRYETRGDRLKKRITSRPPCDYVNDMAKKVTGYIATMTPAEARAAAFDIHGQWFGWGKEMSEDLDREKALNNKISVVFYFPVCIDRLEVLLSEDEDVKKELNRLSSAKFEVTVPDDVEVDGKSSFKEGRYRVWYAIGNVMADDKKNDGFMVKARQIFKETGVNTKDPTRFAADVAMFFNKLSGEVRKDSADDIDWKNETEVIAALMSWRKLQDEDQINIARAIYRLFL